MDHELDKKTQGLRVKVLANGGFDEKRYEYDESFRPADPKNPLEAHTTSEVISFLEADKEIQIDARIIVNGPNGRKIEKLTREQFIEAAKKETSVSIKGVKLQESLDTFAMGSDGFTNAGLVGDDFVPLLGGPYYKNLYYYSDYIRMHSYAFQLRNHSPIAKAVVDITTNFVMGKGFHVDSDDQKALAIWNATAEVNDLQEMMKLMCDELTTYGEDMIWELPNNETKITYQDRTGELPPQGILPRFRLVDPSNIVEIITYPEDITRKLAYVWLTPTQYQIYSQATVGKDKAPQPTLKFIYRQIPAEQMIHVKINCASNEKRGRSDFYPVLGYLKRLDDAVNYAMIGHQKQSAWAIDTSVDGNQADIDNYVNEQNSIGTIAPAGSEFVHSTKITRTFQSNAAGKGGASQIFEWCLSMIAAGTQIPISYFGTHLSGGQTRASAIVATEPVAKKFEMRQELIKATVKKMWDRTMKKFNIKAECEITFPEIITQDRSAKMKDIALAETQMWIKKERAATIAAKELGITDYDYDTEFDGESPDPMPASPAPLSMPGQAPKSSAVTKDEKKQVKDNG